MSRLIRRFPPISKSGMSRLIGRFDVLRFSQNKTSNSFNSMFFDKTSEIFVAFCFNFSNKNKKQTQKETQQKVAKVVPLWKLNFSFFYIIFG